MINDKRRKIRRDSLSTSFLGGGNPILVPVVKIIKNMINENRKLYNGESII